MSLRALHHMVQGEAIPFYKMRNYLKRGSLSFKAVSISCIAVFLFSSLSAYAVEPAQTAFVYALGLKVPSPDKLINLSPSYNPISLRGIRFYPDDPLRFDFLLDEGELKPGQEELKTESAQLIKYFLSSLTIPEEDLWVNLSPYEQDKVIPEELGLTDMGRDLLREDYLLKQLAATLTYPDDPLGKEFWNRVYQKAHSLFGTVKIPINTFNKVWIVPDKAVVYEDKDRAILGEARLKVMLEEDYLAFKNREPLSSSGGVRQKTEKIKLTPQDEENINNFSSSIMKEIVLPEIEKEVNEGRNFAQLRQVYHSLILAIWFKQKLKSQITQIAKADYTEHTQEPLMQKIYVDKKKIKGVDTDDPKVKEKVYQLYCSAYKNGLYNYIKADYDPYERRQIKRRYYSGGVDAREIGKKISSSPLNTMPILTGPTITMSVELLPKLDKGVVGSSSPAKTSPSPPSASSAIQDKSGDTSIHRARDDIERKMAAGDYLSAKQLSEELLSDLRKAWEEKSTGRLMNEWNARYHSDLPKDILVDEIPDAIFYLEVHLVYVKYLLKEIRIEDILRLLNSDQEILRKQAITLIQSLYGLGSGRMDRDNLGYVLKNAEYSYDSKKNIHVIYVDNKKWDEISKGIGGETIRLGINLRAILIPDLAVILPMRIKESENPWDRLTRLHEYRHVDFESSLGEEDFEGIDLELQLIEELYAYYLSCFDLYYENYGNLGITFKTFTSEIIPWGIYYEMVKKILSERASGTLKKTVVEAWDFLVAEGNKLGMKMSDISDRLKKVRTLNSLIKLGKPDLNLGEEQKAYSSIQPPVALPEEPNKGGIDLNPANLDIEVKGEGMSLPSLSNIPFDLQNFQGFTFQIISIQPAEDWRMAAA